VQVTVYPTLVPNTHVLSSINHVFNAVFVRGDVVGDTLFYGRGAGSDATASAVLSDLADASLDLKFGTKHRLPPFVPHEKDGAVLPIDEVVSRYFVRLNVVDMTEKCAIFAYPGILQIGQHSGHVHHIQPDKYRETTSSMEARRRLFHAEQKAADDVLCRT